MKAVKIRDTKHLTAIPAEEWPTVRPPHLAGVWASRRFLVQHFGGEWGDRLTVCRASFKGGLPGEYKDEITWDELQRLKREAGFGDRWAVELFPEDVHIVNVANMRHLWLLPEPPTYGWRNPEVK